MDPSQDNLYETAMRMQQQQQERTFQKLQNAAQWEKQVQHRAMRFATVGITKKLWIYSRTSVLLYIVPTLLLFFAATIFAIGSGLSRSADYESGYAFYAVAGILLMLMFGCMIFGARGAAGFTRFISVVQILVAIPWTALILQSLREPKGSLIDQFPLLAAALLLAMIGFFVLTIFTDLINSFRNRANYLE